MARLSAVHHRALQPRRADVRHLLAPADGPDRLPRRRRSTTTSPTSSSPSCSSSRPTTPRRTSTSTSTRPAAWCRRGMAIYDTMQHLRAPVNTICMGMAASMGSFLLAAGTKGKRSALPHSRIMIHQPSGGAQGTAADIEIQAREILYLRGQAERALRPAHRPAGRDDRAGHGPRPLHERGRGEGVRPHRQGVHATRARTASSPRMRASP